MTKEEILKSQAFRLLNALIAQEANNLQMYVDSMKRNVDSVFKDTSKLELSVGGEPKNLIDITASPHLARPLGNTVGYVTEIFDRINWLKRVKLCLLNDVDFVDNFTDDDEPMDTLHKAVFGDSS